MGTMQKLDKLRYIGGLQLFERPIASNAVA